MEFTTYNNTIPLKTLLRGVTVVILAFALILSYLSWWGICASACAAGHQYRLFGMTFEVAGVLFFTSALGLYCLSWIQRSVRYAYNAMIFSAVGAELKFLLVQSYVIGQWCPLCVTVASTVAALALLVSAEWILKLKGFVARKEGALIMKHVWRGLALIVAILIGFGAAHAGTYKLGTTKQERVIYQDSLSLGNSESPIDVYVYTDWICSSCQKASLHLEQHYGTLLTQTRLHFIDLPIHKPSLEFLPYNLGFLKNHKEHYLALRHHLLVMAQDEDMPTMEEISKLSERMGINFAPLSFKETQEGYKYFKKIAKQEKVAHTPIMILRNNVTGEELRLSGLDEITGTDIGHIITQWRA